ncbi:hypothetical protein EMIT0P218_750001 [Pseudomonas sp. IT-P218]
MWETCRKYGAIAQLGERLPCTQEVNGSIPFGSTTTASDCIKLRNEHSIKTMMNVDF